METSTATKPTSPEYDAFIARLRAMDEADVKAMIERRHPEYDSKVCHWDFLEATHRGGRDWFMTNIHRFVREGDQEYAERVMRAYRFNHTRETVELVNKYIFKAEVHRKEDASPAIQDFWKASTINRRSISDFIRTTSEKASVFGRVWVCTDTNSERPDATILEAKENDVRVYAYNIRPQDLLDLGVDDDGTLDWVKVREFHRDAEDVFASGSIACRYRIWTTQFWALYEERQKDEGGRHETIYELIDSGEHDLGRVPVFPVDHVPSENPYFAPSLVDDIAYLDRAVANYLSNLDTIIQDQTFSQLVMPAQGLMPGDDAHQKLMELGLKRIFTYDASAGAGSKPEYIAPDPKQAGVILAVINKIISEIYHSIGMAGERTKQDNAMGIDNSSGVAKAYDFERVNALLGTKARSLELAENTLCEFIDLWHGKTVKPGEYAYVSYPANFDVRSLSDEIQLALQLALLSAPDEMRRQQMTVLVDKLFPHLTDSLLNKMKAEIESAWPPAPVEVSPNSSSPPSAFQENRQGQNNKGKEQPTSQAKGSKN